jgi:hypothetical protein
MVTSPGLVEAVVEATGSRKSSVEVTLRRLRDNDLVPVGLRGPHATQLDMNAAMRLLLAVCAAKPLEPDAAANAVQRFEPLTPGLPVVEHGKEINPKEFRLPLDLLPADHTLKSALLLLLEHAAEGTLFTNRDANGKLWYFPRFSLLRISFYMPVPMVRVEHILGAFLKKVWVYSAHVGASPEGYLTLVRQEGLGGRTIACEIDDETLTVVALAVKPREKKRKRT